MSREVETRIAAVAARQYGVVTYRQLLEAGASPAGVARRLAAGRLSRLHHGVYLAALNPVERTREMAAVLASGPTAVLSDSSAAGVLGFGLRTTELPADREVEVTASQNRGHHAGIRLHRRRLLRGEWTVEAGIPITTPERTLLDLATRLDAPVLEAAVARAEREGLITRAALSALVERKRGRAGAAGLRKALSVAGGPALTRSAAEAEFLALVRKAGLPLPRSNVRVGPYEIDFLWRAAGLAVEVDGFRYHSSLSSFEGDHRRDAYLMAEGIAVLRLTWRQITRQPLVTVAQLAQALAHASVRRK